MHVHRIDDEQMRECDRWVRVCASARGRRMLVGEMTNSSSSSAQANPWHTCADFCSFWDDIPPPSRMAELSHRIERPASVRRMSVCVPLLIALLQLVDLFTTRVALNGGGVEGNPLSAAVLHSFGFGGAVVEKLFITAVVTVVLRTLGERWMFGAVCAVGVGLAILGWNVAGLQ